MDRPDRPGAARPPAASRACLTAASRAGRALLAFPSAVSRSRRALLAIPLASLAALAVQPTPAAAAPIPMASFEDPAGDANGPGSYTPPTDPAFQEGDFDLRRVAVFVDGDDVLFVITLGAPIRPAPAGGPVKLQDGLALQTIDIYLDTDPTPGAGSAAGLPGRRVAFADGATWEAAVVLTPQPELARRLAREALGPAADRVVFPEKLLVRGRTVTARVPSALLGGKPQPGWGYSVQVSGAIVVAGDPTGPGRAEALTMPVRAVAERFAFGGAPPGQAYPQVVDVLVPEGQSQAAVLGGFDAASGSFAKVPFVYGLARQAALDATAAAASTPSPASPPAARPTAAPAGLAVASSASAPPSALAASAADPLRASPSALSANLMPRLQAGPTPGAASSGTSSAAGGTLPPLSVVEVADDFVTAKGPVAGIQVMQFGRVVDGQGITVARVMVLRLLDKGLHASVIAGKERITPGAVLLFDRAGAGQAEAPAAASPKP